MFEVALRQQMVPLALNFIPQMNELSVLAVQNERRPASGPHQAFRPLEENEPRPNEILF
jgi:hypothetical protein